MFVCGPILNLKNCGHLNVTLRSKNQISSAQTKRKCAKLKNVDNDDNIMKGLVLVNLCILFAEICGSESIPQNPQKLVGHVKNDQELTQDVDHIMLQVRKTHIDKLKDFLKI